jgi:Transglutaminase-like superfamily
MTDGDSPAYSSIQARIAALNLNQVGRTPGTPPPSYDQVTNGTNGTNLGGKRKPPPPPLPKRPPRPNGTPATNGDAEKPQLPSRPNKSYPNSENGDAISPALPPRRPSSTQANNEDTPSLPPRRPSGQLNPNTPRRISTATLGRRGSQESIASTTSIMSSRTNASTASKHRVRAPDYDPSTLPPLPSRRKKEEVDETPQLPLRPTLSAPNVPNRISQNGDRDRPPLPGRPRSTVNDDTETPPPLPGNRPSVPSLPSRPTTNGSTPPPIPMASRPDLSTINASKPRPNAAPESCLICRDYSAADQHATKFPRTAVPSQDPMWLGRELGAPFPDVVDKARAIFTWLHHNIDYDVHSFFNKCIRGTTPEATVQSGLAVCSGYAGLFNALARGAGIQCVEVVGHGKGKFTQPIKLYFYSTKGILWLTSLSPTRYQLQRQTWLRPTPRPNWPCLERLPPLRRQLEASRRLLGRRTRHQLNAKIHARLQPQDVHHEQR